MRFFTSDHHFFHRNAVLKYGRKEFNSLNEMHESLINNWNSKITNDDTVYVLGDFSLGRKEETRIILGRLNGRKILIRGNHDKYSKNKLTALDFIGIGFDDVMDEETLTLSNGEQVTLKHYPQQESRIRRLWDKLTRKKSKQRAYHAFYPTYHGLWHIHGHFHNGPKVNGKQINVNVDVRKYKPVSEKEICDVMRIAKEKSLSNRLLSVILGVRYRLPFLGRDIS